MLGVLPFVHEGGRRGRVVVREVAWAFWASVRILNFILSRKDFEQSCVTLLTL